MKKTSLYLEPELDQAIKRLAATEHVSQAEVIRRVLRAAVEHTSTPVVTAIGVGTGPGDVAADVDHHLEETGFGR